jgi:hypothetical protein
MIALVKEWAQLTAAEQDALTKLGYDKVSYENVRKERVPETFDAYDTFAAVNSRVKPAKCKHSKPRDFLYRKYLREH